MQFLGVDFGTAVIFAHSIGDSGGEDQIQKVKVSLYHVYCFLPTEPSDSNHLDLIFSTVVGVNNVDE